MVWQSTGKSEVSGFESLRTAKVNFDISPGNLCNFSSGFIKIRTWTRRWFCFDSTLLVINIILTIIWQFVKTRKGVGCYSNVWRFCSHKSRSAAEAKHKINIFSDAANGCWNCMLTVSYFLGVFVFWVFGVYLIVVCFSCLIVALVGLLNLLSGKYYEIQPSVATASAAVNCS